MQYDVVVIGAGPGGYVAAIRAAQLGLKVACIQSGETLGGTCLNVGCIPSKALLQSSEHYAFTQKEAAVHGIEAKEVHLNFDQMMRRKEEVVKGLVQGVAALLKKNKIEWIQGTATLISPNQIKVSNGQTVEAAHIILATGSESITLPFLPIDEKVVLSSTGALSLSKIPKKLLVIGAGVIGVELASVYSRLGAEVTVIEMLDIVCPGLDRTVSKTIGQILKKQGLTFHLQAQVTKAMIREDGVTLSVSRGEEIFQVDGDALLVAIGRKAYSKGLGLENIGIELDAAGRVPVNGNFQTAISNIYAIGDLIDGPMLAHKASEEGVAAAELIAGLSPHVNYMAIPNVVYTNPEVATVGLTEEAVRERGIEPLIGTYSFRGNPRARCMGQTDGIVKIVGDKKTGRLLGMHIVGAVASEIIAEGVIALEKRATIEEVAAASHAHPTLSESVKEACLNALGRTIHQ